MRRQLATFCLLAAGLLMISGNLIAHHAEAGSYDNNLRVTVKAVVTDIVWVNPHAQIYVDFKNDKGETEHWGVEMLSPGNLVRIGWGKNTFKPGDEILVSMTPAKGGRAFGSCAQFVSAAGKQYMVGQCGVPGGDLAAQPVKEGYKKVEVKFPVFPKGQVVAGPAIDPQQ